MPGPLRLARLAGGITYQPQFTFQQRLFAVADEIQAELLCSSPSNTWPPRGFEVSLAQGDKVRIEHLRHEGWFALVGAGDIYFRYDYPDSDNMDETLRVQTELFSRITTRLAVEPIRSIGIKFISISRMTGTDEIAHVIPRLGLFPGQAPSPLPRDPIDVTIRVSYPLFDGTTASLQMAVDAENSTFLLDIDCACRDAFSIPMDHLDFYAQCNNHFAAVTRTVQHQVLPGDTSRIEGR